MTLAQMTPIYDSDPPRSRFHCVGLGLLAQEVLCVTALRAGPGKALPRADNQCLVWIKRKNKALRIIEADEEKTRDSNMRAKADYCFEPLMG